MLKVNPEQLAFVQEVGCANDCATEIKINDGLALPCKEWTNEESAMLRRRMLVDNQLMSSGLLKRLSRSSLGNSLRYRKYGIDVGPIRTQDSGAHAVNECGVTFDSIRMEDFEKRFYVVNTEKNIQMCIKQFIGTKWQDMISQRYGDYNAEDFEGTDLADMIIASIIEKYTEFVPKFLLMATCNGSGEDMHGDDGIMAKAYYASKGQYFHTLQFDLSSVANDFANVYINAIVGGDRYSAAPTDFASSDEYLLDFLTWLNTRKEKRDYLFNASLDLATSQLYVASTFATRIIDLRIILNDGTETPDWKCKPQSEMLAPIELQRNMMINDVPLLFKYENIDETNFWQKFKEYMKEFKRYIHRNGFSDINVNDIVIGIDPELLLEYEDQQNGKFIDCCEDGSNTADRIGLSLNRFIPLNSLNDTGLFFMTVRGNLLLLDDGDNIEQAITNFGRIQIKESNCDKPGLVNIYGGVPPMGSDVEHWGLFATNICDSYFVTDNKLDERGPCENAKLQLVCYDDNVKNYCVVDSTCHLYASVDADATYDSVADTTTIAVSVNSNQPQGTTLVYNLSYSLSDGTAQTGITSSNFTITLPGDQTDSGVVINVTGTVEAQDGNGAVQCSCPIVYSSKLGEGDPTIYCTLTDSNDGGANSVTTALNVTYTVNGNTTTIPLSDPALDYSSTGDFDAIESEIEAIFPNTTVVLSNPSAALTDISISNLPSFISNVVISSTTTGNGTATLVAQC